MQKTGSFRYSVSIRLNILFILSIIILLIMGFSIYRTGMNSLRTSIIEAESIRNRDYAIELSRELKRITLLQYDLVTNRDLVRISTLEDVYGSYETQQMILRIEEKLAAIKNSSSLIDEINVIIPLINTTISTASTGRISRESEELIQGYGIQSNKQVLAEGGSILLISEFPEHYYLFGEDPYFLIHATISETSMSRFLSGIESRDAGRRFIYSDSRDILISSAPDEGILEGVLTMVQTGSGRPISREAPSEDSYLIRSSINRDKYIIIYSDTGLADIRLVRYIPESSILNEFVKYRVFISLFAVTALLFTLFFSRTLYNLIHEPLHKLIAAFDELKRFNFPVYIQHEKEDEFKYIYENFDRMSATLEELIDQVYKQKLLMEQSKLKQLQSQINPHFLYNSFLLLRNRILTEDIDFASEFCDELGAYFMYITRDKEETVTLEKEMQHTLSYCRIQEARFRQRMELRVEALPPHFREIMVPRIIFQPLLENAFEYAVETRLKGSVIAITFGESGEDLTINVEDNGDTGDDTIRNLNHYIRESGGEITALRNIDSRLKLHFNENSGLHFSRSSMGGLKVSVLLHLAERIRPKGRENV